MRLPTTRIVLGIFVLALLAPHGAVAQSTGATLSGTITASTQALPNAAISIRNLSTGRVTEALTDAAGEYVVGDLPAGDYDVSASAEGFGAGTARVTLAPGAMQTVDLTLTATPAAAPAGPPGLSLDDLGFAPQETTGSAAAQARLDKRSHMLKWHQRFGLVTAAPMVATLFTAGHAKGRHGTASGRRLHAELGGLTAALYATTASLAIFAPKIEGTKPQGPIRVHRALAWIHGTGMILTPILGAMAYRQISRGEHVHGIAQAHGPVAAITAIAYGAAVLSVSVKF